MNVSHPTDESVSTSQLGRNFGWMTWSALVSIANSVAVWVFIARMRDVEEVGRFSIAMGLYALFFSIVSLGLMPYVVNEISRRLASDTPESSRSVPRFISSVTAFLLLSGIVTAFIMTATGIFVSESSTVRLSTFALSLALLPSGLIMVCEAKAIATGRTRFVAAVSTIENVLRTIIPLFLIWAGYDMVTICLSFGVVRFIGLATYLVGSPSHLSKFSFSRFEFHKIVSIFPTFAGTIIFASINWQAALILLGLIGPDAETAKFGVASRFLIPVTILMASYANVIQPTLAKHLLRSPEKLGVYLATALRIPLVVATLIAIGSTYFSPWTLRTLFGETYENASQTLDILAISTIPFCLVIVVARALVAVDSQRVDLFANILGVVVCVITGVILIPRYGAAGAALAHLLSFVSMAAVEIAYLSRRLTHFKIWRTDNYEQPPVVRSPT